MDILSIIFHTLVVAILGWLGCVAWAIWLAVKELKQWLNSKKSNDNDPEIWTD